LGQDAVGIVISKEKKDAVGIGGNQKVPISFADLARP
jgi:hypothetical protein